MTKIIPAILTDSVEGLQKKLDALKGLSDWVQIDIMDGKFVGNNSVSLEEISKMSGLDGFSLELHLMVLHPEKLLELCQKIKAKRVIFHFEAVEKIKTVLSEAKKFGFQTGVALNPETPVSKVTPYLEEIYSVLLMSVNPGFQGQEFLPDVLEKIKELRGLAPEKIIEVDGGINLDNAKDVKDAGADYLILGKSLSAGEGYQKNLELFSNLLQ